jgi:hypothetical protein
VSGAATWPTWPWCPAIFVLKSWSIPRGHPVCISLLSSFFFFKNFNSFFIAWFFWVRIQLFVTFFLIRKPGSKFSRFLWSQWEFCSSREIRAATQHCLLWETLGADLQVRCLDSRSRTAAQGEVGGWLRSWFHLHLAVPGGFLSTTWPVVQLCWPCGVRDHSLKCSKCVYTGDFYL